MLDQEFPEYHPLYKFNPFIYMISGTPRNPVYIFRWNEIKGVIVGINESKEYFKGTIKPIKFLDDYNWEENPTLNTYAVNSWEKVVRHLNNMVVPGKVSNNGNL